MNIREELEKRNGNHEAFVFQDVEVKPERIRAVLINEVVPSNPADDFYGGDGAAYLSTAIPLFQKAGAQADSLPGRQRAAIRLRKTTAGGDPFGIPARSVTGNLHPDQYTENS